MQAVIYGQKEQVMQCVEQGINQHVPDKLGWTFLLYAVFQENAEIVNILLKHTDVSISDQRKMKTPLMLAAERESFEVLEAILLNHCCTINDQKGCTALMYAAAMNKNVIVNHLLEHGALTHIKDKNGHTVLDIAVKEHAVEVIACLMENTIRNKMHDNDALFTAVSVGQHQWVERLLEIP